MMGWKLEELCYGDMIVYKMDGDHDADKIVWRLMWQNTCSRFAGPFGDIVSYVHRLQFWPFSGCGQPFG